MIEHSSISRIPTIRTRLRPLHDVDLVGLPGIVAQEMPESIEEVDGDGFQFTDPKFEHVRLCGNLLAL
jgi:hypothetical protein